MTGERVAWILGSICVVMAGIWFFLFRDPIRETIETIATCHESPDGEWTLGLGAVNYGLHDLGVLFTYVPRRHLQYRLTVPVEEDDIVESSEASWSLSRELDVEVDLLTEGVSDQVAAQVRSSIQSRAGFRAYGVRRQNIRTPDQLFRQHDGIVAELAALSTASGPPDPPGGNIDWRSPRFIAVISTFSADSIRAFVGDSVLAALETTVTRVADYDVTVSAACDRLILASGPAPVFLKTAELAFVEGELTMLPASDLDLENLPYGAAYHRGLREDAGVRF